MTLIADPVGTAPVGTHDIRRDSPGERTRRPSWWAPVREVASLGFLYAVFTAVQTLIGGHTSDATSDATRITAVESALGVGIERTANTALATHPVLATLASAFYALLLFGPIAVLAWCLARHRQQYRRRRNILVLMTFTALPVFAAFPVAPPRLHLPGITDIVAASHLMGPATASGSVRLGDLDAAMPSLHVAWACWCAWALAGSSRRWLRHLGATLPIVTAVDVVATGNHYVLDVAAGALLFVVSLGTYEVWHARPGVRARVPPVHAPSDHAPFTAGSQCACTRRTHPQGMRIARRHPRAAEPEPDSTPPTWRYEAVSVHPLLTAHPTLVAVYCAAATLLLVAGLREVPALLPGPIDELLLVACVVAASATGIRRAAMVTAVAAAAGYALVLIPAATGADPTSQEDLGITALLLVLGVAIAQLSSWGRRQQAAAMRDAAYVEAMVVTAQVSDGSGRCPEWAREAIALRIGAVLGATSARYASDLDVEMREPGPVPARIERDGTVSIAGDPVDVRVRGLPTDRAILIEGGGRAGPASGGIRGGVLVWTTREDCRPSLRQRRVAVALADRLA